MSNAELIDRARSQASISNVRVRELLLDLAAALECAEAQEPSPSAPYIEPEMVVIPAGSFLMGSPKDELSRWPNEGPQHLVTFAHPFECGKYAVTFDEWDACREKKYKPADEGWGRGRRPVINVSFEDAKQYTAWLSHKAGKNYRLLTEAEWEYACRAGTTTAFSTGATITTSQANYNGLRTMPVGSYAPNAWGLHDMHGNVLEWTEDCWSGSYHGGPSDGSAWTSGDCALRVLRGGSWDLNPWDLRSAFRDHVVAAVRDVSGGFRLARTIAK